MPVTHSELFHSWRIRSGVRAAAAAACGGGADGSRHCFWIAPVTCLKQGLAAILLRARRAAPGGPRRFREDQHGARHGPAGAADSAGIFFCPRPLLARKFDIAFLPEGIRNSSGPGYLSSGNRHTGHSEQRLSLWWTAPWSLCPYLPPRGRAPRGYQEPR